MEDEAVLYTDLPSSYMMPSPKSLINELSAFEGYMKEFRSQRVGKHRKPLEES